MEKNGKSRSIIAAAADYLMACPLLRAGAFRIDALGDEPTEYSIDVGTFNPIIEEYIDGSSDRRYVLDFNSREQYDLDRVQNIANSTFYEDLTDWLDEQNRAGNLPDLPEGCHAETIAPISSGFLLSENGTSARYQIQIQITYHKDSGGKRP